MTLEDRFLAQAFPVTWVSPPASGEPFAKPASGITIHYTAGSSVTGSVETLRARELAYHLIIDRDGTIFQMASLGVAVAHAGRASWHGESPNRRHVAIALANFGYLDEGSERFAALMHDGLVKYRAGNVTKKKQPWEMATRAQEQTLLSVLRWFVNHGVAAERICGHDECALPLGRKQDPGGILSWPMAELRSLVAVTAK